MKRILLALAALVVSVAAFAFSPAGKKFRSVYTENGMTLTCEMSFSANGTVTSTMKVTGYPTQSSQNRWWQDGDVIYSDGSSDTWLQVVERGGQVQLDLYDNGVNQMTFKEVKATPKKSGTTTRKKR